ncbi:hypothetical protein CD943_04530 [Brevundimonas diminuta]|uniref:Uncharacterized protein n=1 Tax=Brevundimonas diminuta TaxID=293 RepID=A0A1Z3LVH7_BREDI|nr:hypothetical protein CD943_04530 [Brevundimonas diminuta]
MHQRRNGRRRIAADPAGAGPQLERFGGRIINGTGKVAKRAGDISRSQSRPGRGDPRRPAGVFHPRRQRRARTPVAGGLG